MAKPGGRLQAETGRMLRAGLFMFGAAWFGLLLLGAQGHATRDAAFLFAVPAGVVNLMALVLLAQSYAWVWGRRADDPGHHKRSNRRLVTGTWLLVVSLVLYVLGLLLHSVQGGFW